MSGAPSGEDVAVSLRSLTRHFGGRAAVDGLSLDIRRGELFGIVGPDGAGKTTTLRMLAGVLRPTSGDAAVLGIGVAARPEEVKPHIAYMAQRFGLYDDLTVAENLAFYADLYSVPRGERTARLERLYRFSDLAPFRDRLAGNLSGGMKQKLSLSCALVHEPELLLLDEPTFGVDPISRRDLWLILHERVAAGVTVVVSTSYMDEAERCDRVVLLDRGRALALDAPQALQASLGGEMRALWTDAPRRARDLLRASPAVARATLYGDSIHVWLRGDDTWEAARAALRDAGVAIHDDRAVPPSLEDVFIQLVTDAGAAHA